MVGHARALVLGDWLQWPIRAFVSLKNAFWLQVIDFYVCWIYGLFGSQLLHTWPNSSVRCVSATWCKGRGFDPSAQKYFPWKNTRNDILMYGAFSRAPYLICKSLIWYKWMDHNVLIHLLVCSFISHRGL